MFYSQFILAKKGPLGTIWIAAHLERKLRKNQVADTDIGVSVDSILFPEVPIALRLSSHLLLGVVRIYNRKVNYLFDDCSEALLKVKQAFRSTAVDLPPEESKAPYHSITLPETFDLDDFELPDSDIYQGNYVDHHISSREQITLQDNIEGVSYSTSKFGLDERFGDGDASGLDLDEELFMDKIGAAGHADESTDPQASVGSMSSLKPVEHPEDRAADSEAMVDGGDGDGDVMDYAPGPSTPGLVEEPNLSTVQEVSAYDEHMESEFHAAESSMRENDKSIPDEDKQEVDWCSHGHAVSDGITQGPPEANEKQSNVLDIQESKPEVESFVDDEFASLKENLAVDDGGTNEIGSEKIPEISGLDSTGQKVLEGVSIENLDSSAVDVPGSKENESDGQKPCPDASELVPENQDGSVAEHPVTEACQENDVGEHGKEMVSGTPFLRPCSSILEQTDDDNQLDTSEKQETTKQGEEHSINHISEEPLENQVDESALNEQCPAAPTEPGDQINISKSPDRVAEDLKNSEEALLPAPEKMLSVPEGHVDLERSMLDEVTPREFEVLEEGDAGSKTVTGKKRSFTESTLTEQSLNSAESSRQVRGKRTAESVPDDNDLLSSILVGRRSSALKVKPTPPVYEVTSVKRTRTSLRSGSSKRKVLMDDTMVLHGDTIRQQLMNTEDIRRVRKKAPCTRPEIRMIQIQHMEDEIFLEAVFPGMSVELASLHSQVHDLSQISICQNVAPNISEIVSDSQNETVVGTTLTSPVDNNDVREPHQVSHDNDIGVNHDIENDEGPDKTTITTENELGIESEHLFEGEKEITENVEIPLEEVGYTNTEANASQEQITPTSDADLLLDVSEKETSQVNAEPINPAVIDGLESLDLIGHATNDVDDASAHLVQTVSLYERAEPNSAANADASALEFDNGHQSAINDAQAISMDELTEKDGEVDKECEIELGTRDDIPSDVAQDGVAVGLDSNVDHGDLKYDAQNEIFDATFEGKLGEFSYLAQETLLEDGSLNNGLNPADPETYQPNLMDPEISAFGVQDQDELSHLATGNDTGFLNVDDDELDEMADDDMPDNEGARLTENTGWSSRTRAVSKYLQTTFMKEAETGNKSLLMDYLLTGKTRKEASRMFFETLVLKTRDYIHVDQKNPFGDITIKPRTKLMKSDF